MSVFLNLCIVLFVSFVEPFEYNVESNTFTQIEPSQTHHLFQPYIETTDEYEDDDLKLSIHPSFEAILSPTFFSFHVSATTLASIDAHQKLSSILASPHARAPPV